MAMQTVSAMVDGGKASAGPPIGPSLAPLKMPVQDIIKEINEKTQAMAGIKVPVKIHVDPAKKSWEIEVGTPTASTLIKKELGLEKGSGTAGKERIADLPVEKAKSIAKIKFGADDDAFVSQVKGTARSMGISVGQGEVTEEEKAKYEEAKKAEEAAAAEKAGAKKESGEEGKEEKKDDSAKDAEKKEEKK